MTTFRTAQADPKAERNARIAQRWSFLDFGFEELGDGAFNAYVEATYAAEDGSPLFDEQDAQDIERLDALLTEGVRIVRDALQRKGKL